METWGALPWVSGENIAGAEAGSVMLHRWALEGCSLPGWDIRSGSLHLQALVHGQARIG